MSQALCGKGRGRGEAGPGCGADCSEKAAGPPHARSGLCQLLLNTMYCGRSCSCQLLLPEALPAQSWKAFFTATTSKCAQMLDCIARRHNAWTSKHLQQALVMFTGRPVLSYGKTTVLNTLPYESSTPCQPSFTLSKSSLSTGASTLTTQELRRNMQRRTHCRIVSACLAMTSCYDEGFVTTRLPMLRSPCSDQQGFRWQSDLKTEAYLDLHMGPHD